jgi:hypothetical protein
MHRIVNAPVFFPSVLPNLQSFEPLPDNRRGFRNAMRPHSEF